MYQSSAEYFMGSQPKVRNSRSATGKNPLQSIRTLVGQRKWQVVIGVCLLMSVVAVAFPATVGHSMRQTSRRRAVTRAIDTVAENEPADESREVFNAPMVDKKALPVHHKATKAKPRKVTTKKHKNRPPSTRKPPTKKPAARRPPTRKPPTRKPPNRKPPTRKPPTRKPPTRKPPKMAEEKKEPEESEKDVAKAAPLEEEVSAHEGSAAPAVAASRTLVDSTTEKTTGKPVGMVKIAAHQQEGPPPGNESIFRFTGASSPNDSASGDHNVEDIRLPRTVKPLAYKLVLAPIYGEQSMSFKGNVRITLEALAPTKLIQLHAANLVINRANLSLNFVSTAPGPDILSIRTNDYSQFLYINLAEDLVMGDKYELHIPFTTGALYDNGFNVRHYQRESGPPVWVYGSNFLPTEARRTFPCFDEPGMKAPFSIEVIRPNDLHTLSNMPSAAVYPKPEDHKADVFIPTFPMPTFSAGIFISDFISYGNGTMKLWARPGAARDVDFLLEMGPKILNFYEEYFASPYQVPKTDIIAMEHYISDIQNMGLLYLPEAVAFYDAEDSSVAKRQGVMLSLCHAFSHEWFGNLVSPEWWDDVWLMDGFATYFQYRCLEFFDQSIKSYDLMIVNEIVPVMKHDIMKYAPAVVMNVDSQYRIYQSFNVFSTQKAVALLRMLDMAVGETSFKNGVHNILEKRMFGNVTSEFVWEAFTEAQPKKRPLNVKKVMEPWVTQPGFPILNVNRVYDENAATLVQSRFALEPEERESRYTWPIPITMVSSEDRLFSNTMPVVWLFDKEGQLENLPSAQHWVLINSKFASYYKVNYDAHNWDLIVRQLLWNHSYIDPLNRAQIQNDLFDLAKAGLVNYTVALEATKYLLREQDYIPWKAAFEKMKDVGVRLQTTESYSRWKGYVSSLLSANFANISWDGNETSLLSAELESELAFLTCFYGYQPCIDKAMEMFKEVQDNTPLAEDMPSHLRYTVFCEAVKNGGEKNWKFLWDRLQEGEDLSERGDIIKALSCSRSPELLGNKIWHLFIRRSYLKSVVKPDDVIRHEDVPSILTSFTDNLEGRPVAFKFINNEWGSIHKRFRQMPEALLQIEESLIESASESSDVELLTSFYNRNKKSTMIPEWRYKQVHEERKLDDVWKSRFYPVVKHWLDEIDLPAL